MPGRAQLCGNLRPGIFSRGQQSLGLFEIIRAKAFWPSPNTTPLPRSDQPRHRALPQLIPLKLRHQREYAKHKFAAWASRVDQVLSQGPQLDAAFVQEIDGFDQVQKGAPEPIKPPHDSNIALPSMVEQPHQFGPISL